MEHDEFCRLLRQRGEELYRNMPWRDDTRPYYVLVSELMLQQTQVDRVVPKFRAFIDRFPDEKSLASAPLADVLKLWQGLGYNRRAKFLHESAKSIVSSGSFPVDKPGLRALPGVGENTAGAILAYAYNQPAIFIETNVRAVYIHHFYSDRDSVDDADIQSLLQATLDHDDPRTFYWALMDYGSWLKKNGVRPSRSKHYKKQTALSGSVREVRGQILRELASGPINHDELIAKLPADPRAVTAINGLIRDGLITVENNVYDLTK